MNKDPITSTSPQPAPEPEKTHLNGSAPETIGKPPLSPAAQRALAEAEARRKAHDIEVKTAEREVGGRGGADPARFGDWEINGRAIDF